MSKIQYNEVSPISHSFNSIYRYNRTFHILYRGAVKSLLYQWRHQCSTLNLGMLCFLFWFLVLHYYYHLDVLNQDCFFYSCFDELKAIKGLVIHSVCSLIFYIYIKAGGKNSIFRDEMATLLVAKSSLAVTGPYLHSVQHQMH